MSAAAGSPMPLSIESCAAQKKQTNSTVRMAALQRVGPISRFANKPTHEKNTTRCPLLVKVCHDILDIENNRNQTLHQNMRLNTKDHKKTDNGQCHRKQLCDPIS